MKISAQIKSTCAELEKHIAKDPGVVHVGVGYCHRGGEKTNTIGIVVGVKRKGDAHATVLVPASFNGIETDVQEFGELRAQGHVSPADLRNRVRPIAGGHSIGHFRITAGTLGTWAEKAGELVALTNNHVAANSNNAAKRDPVLQPGPADGGGFPSDAGLFLEEFAIIRFGEGPPTDPPPTDPPPTDPPDDPPPIDPGKCKGLATIAWRSYLAIPNALASLVDCPNRAVVINAEARRERFRARALAQPWPNLVDAAICRPSNDQNSAPTAPVVSGLGIVGGLVDLELGDDVQKVGRTTGHTEGVIESIGSARVSYGSAGIAVFRDQLIIRGRGGDFSAGGDSGSAILDPERRVGGLLFAGGGGVTIANRIQHVVAIMGVTV